MTQDKTEFDPRSAGMMLQGGPRKADPDSRRLSGPLSVRLSDKRHKLTIAQAVGRVLSQDVVAPQPVPLWRMSVVNGDAIRSADTALASTENPVQLEQAPHRTPGRKLLCSDETLLYIEKGERSMAGVGTRLPAGADAVLPPWAPEYAGKHVQQLEKKITRPVSSGQGVQQAGDEIAPGTLLAEAGQRLKPHHIAAMAMAGVKTVEVMPRPRVAVLSVHDYYQAPDTEGSTWAPDAMTPLVLALLEQWGAEATTVCHFSHDPDRKAQPMSSAILSGPVNDLCRKHELTIQVGGSFRGFGGQPTKNRPLGHFNQGFFQPMPDGWQYDGGWLTRPISNPFVCSQEYAVLPNGHSVEEQTAHLFVSLDGLPLSVFAGMYLTVRWLLDALEGVDTKRIDPFYGYPNRPATAEERALGWQRQAESYNPRAQPQGVHWLNGVLAAPAPRHPHGPWLQLARFDHSVPGRTGLVVLPSEEWRVASLLHAEAMVAIEPGETELPEGSPVQFFVLD